MARTQVVDIHPSHAESLKLLRKGFNTAKQLGMKRGLSKPSAHGHIKALEERYGIKFETKQVREGEKGPLATSYRAKP